MNLEMIRRRLRKGGPQVIRTADGNEYQVSHPEFVLGGRHNLIIEESDGSMEIIDPLRVVAIRRGPAGKGQNSGLPTCAKGPF